MFPFVVLTNVIGVGPSVAAIAAGAATQTPMKRITHEGTPNLAKARMTEVSDVRKERLRILPGPTRPAGPDARW